MISRAGIWRGDDEAAIRRYVRLRADPTAQPATLFDQAWYVGAYPEAAASGLSPLVHYLVHGAAAAARPHPLLHPTHYESQNLAALRARGVSPLEHYLHEGAAPLARRAARF